ncbi:MAG TPA: hypothetical protein VEW05_20365 [Candidatus Polarisedimenticolia bacterium]|nr:hypothetical protein [Candidatus Polarisedimenticolia bacterium]
MRIRKRLLAEAGVMAAFSLLAILTALNHNWIELVFGVDPDSGNGWIEWALVAAPALDAVLGTAGAYHKWSKARSAVWEAKNG